MKNNKTMAKILESLGFVETEEDWVKEDLEADTFFCIGTLIPCEEDRKRGEGDKIIVGEYWRAGFPEEATFEDMIELSTFILENYD